MDTLSLQAPREGSMDRSGLLMDRSGLLEVASQYLDRVIILLTVAGEDRLAQDI